MDFRFLQVEFLHTACVCNLDFPATSKGYCTVKLIAMTICIKTQKLLKSYNCTTHRICNVAM